MTTLTDDLAARVLREIGLLGADEQAPVRRVAELAAWICGVPMGAVTLVEQERQVFVGATGLPVRETPRDASFCAIAMQDPSTALVVADATLDPRFVDNPLVTGEPGIRSYAGVPLVAPEGVAIGAVCAIGDVPGRPTPQQLEALEALAAITVELLESRRTATRLALTLVELDRAHRSAATSREQFQTAFDHAPVGMSVATLDGRYVAVNRSFADLLQSTPAELAGRGSWEVSLAEDADADAATARRLRAQGGGSALCEKHYVRADGVAVPALVTTSLVDAGAGDPPLLLNFVESIAERRAAEARLLEVQSAHDGIISIDEAGLVTAWNLGAERLFGHPSASRLGRSLEAVVPPGLWARHSAGVRRLVAGGVPRLLDGTTTVPAVRADGSEVLVELALSRWVQDGRTGFTGVLRDITERHRAQELTELVRRAASTANDAQTLAEALSQVLADACARLHLVAAVGWTAGDGPATWALGEHPHAPGTTCALAGRTAPLWPLPSMPGTIVATAEEITVELGAGGPDPNGGDPLAAGCGTGWCVMVPVLAGEEVAAALAFLLPTGAPEPDTGLRRVLEQLGVLLGRVVERERTAALLRHQATHDPLTDLANRRRLLQEVGALQSRPADAARGAVLMVDLDRFRLVNDSLGHVAGDAVLLEASRRLLGVVGPGDFVARLGGDEFVLLVAGVAGVAGGPGVAGVAGVAGGVGADGWPAAAGAIAERVLAALEGDVVVEGQRLPLRASIGVSPLDGPPGTLPEAAAPLRQADAALRLAKRRGASRVEVFDEALRSDSLARLAEEGALARAVAAGELTVHYQPVVDLGTGRAVGAEALVRWPREGLGLVPPDRFIPLAEESGIIVDLGRFVLRRACSDAAGWDDRVPGLAGGTVSVNVSPRQLTHPRFLADVDRALADSQLPPGRLTVEITESALVEDSGAVRDVLAAVRARGVGLALDDFGTGYSSLGYVQTLPVDVLKVDKSFVDAITGPGRGTALTEVVLKLAEATGLRTVAEGVETAAQAEALRALGCRSGQGYVWSRPVPAEGLPAAVAALPDGPRGG